MKKFLISFKENGKRVEMTCVSHSIQDAIKFAVKVSPCFSLKRV